MSKPSRASIPAPTEATFQEIADNIREIFWIFDPEFARAIYVSPAYEAIWGRPLETVYDDPRSFLAAVHPDDVERVVEGMGQIREGVLEGTAYRVLRPDGDVRWVWSRGYPIRDDGGAVRRVVGTTADITDRKHAEEALQRSEERFRTLFEQSSAAVLIHDEHGRILQVNQRLRESLGYTREELVGMRVSEIEIGADPRELEAAWGEMVSGTPRLINGVHRRKDGSTFPVDVWVRGITLHGERLVLAEAHDVTERHEAERQRAAAEAHYRRLVENAPYGVYALDAEGRFIELNPAGERIAGMSAEEVLGRHFSEVIAPVDHDVATDAFDRVISGEADHIEFDERVRRPSGEERLVRATESAIREGGEIVGTHGIARDVTDEAERERSLRRAERLASVGTLIGGVAHELNNPLHAIRNFAELMLMTERDEDDHEALSIIRREADRVATIVSDLRLIARETQEGGGPREAVDLNDVIRHVVKIRRYAMETEDLEVRQELAEDLPPALANRGEIEQALLNLVVNAEQAMSGHAGERRLTLRTRRVRHGVAVHVVDSGPGIAPSDLGRIFDPFFTTKPPGEGTGLGLSLAHSIVIENGGHIRVESEPGNGAEFHIELPAAPSGGAIARTEAKEATRGRSLRVLIVDDEEAIRRVSVRFLERLGHDVDAAADGEQALRLLDEADYDVILSDLRMPGLDGEELLRRLRERGEGLEHRLTFMTGDAASARAARVVAEAGVPVLVKPMRLEDLARAVERGGKGRRADPGEA